MSGLSIVGHLSAPQIRQQLYNCSNGHQASYWQIILSLNNHPGKKACEYACFLGCSITKLYRISGLYNKHGAQFLKYLQWGGRREARCMMRLEEEKQLLAQLTADALQGKVLVAKQLRALVAQKTDRKVSDDYLWDLLHRHGWKKKAPRPRHPKADKEQQEAFKKTTVN